MAKILVTGGAGFIGSHLCRKLLDSGDEVLCVDNFFTGTKDNILDLLDNKKFDFLRHDVTFPLYVEVDQIYNLACPASPIHYQFDPVQTTKTSVHGAINMLGLAKRTKARILQASTSEVYGDPEIHPQPESYWGRVNPIGIRSCFSQDTEILTKNGWKYLKEVMKNDEIATLNINGIIEYQLPSEIIKQRYQGELIEFKNDKIDLMVTPNHKMYVKKRDSKKFELIEAFRNIPWNRANMKKDADWKGKEEKWFVLPKVKNCKSKMVDRISMDDWLEFMGYYISEGCAYLRKRKRTIKQKEYSSVDYNILIAQDRIKSKNNWNRIKKCLERLPFKFYHSDDHQFRICNKQLFEYLRQFGKSKDKFIPTELKNLSKRQLKILCDALMLGDGNKKGTDFHSSSKKLIGDFQELLLKLGLAGSIGTKDKRKKNPVYHVHILTNNKRNFLTPLYPKREIKWYDDYVYCVNVPNHVIYVRRNGKAQFCGNCYDEGKRCAETLFFDYWRQHKMDIRVIRIFNTYGPNMHPNDGRVVSNFIVQALKNEDITIYGNGSQTRSFQYVDDLIEGMTRMMNNDQNFIGPVNLGNPNEFTIKQLAEKVLELIPESKSKIIYKDLPADDPKQRQPDISLAKEKLSWEPTIQLEEGLKKTIAYFERVVH